MIKAVFIDVDNTLLDFDKCSEQAMRDTCADFAIPYEPYMFGVFKKINIGLWRRLEDGLITKDDLFAVRWNNVFAALDIPVDGPAFEVRFHDYLNVSAVPIEGAREALAYLASKYRVFVASNAPKNQQPYRLEKAGMSKYIEKFFISDELGYPKPQKKFFDACFAFLPDITPAQTVMIGDSLTADIRGAKVYGMRTCWYNYDALPYDGSEADMIVNAIADVKLVL